MADIIHRIGIKASPSRVYDAVATIAGVAGWWTRDATGSDRKGGTVNVRFLHQGGDEIGQMEYELVTLDPGREVTWRFIAGPPEWIGTEASFKLSQDGDTTVINFGHRHWKEPVEFMAHCSMKWAVFLLSLRDLVELGKGQPAPGDRKIDNWN